MAKAEATTIVTERLILRRRMESDIPAMVKMFNTDSVREYLFGTPPRDEHSMLAMVRHRVPTTWYIILKDTDEYIGECGFWSVVNDYYSEIFYIFAESAWGNGYAYEAMTAAIEYGTRSLNIKLLSAKIHNENERSKRLAKRFGLTLDCVIPEFEIDGTIADVARYRKVLP